HPQERVLEAAANAIGRVIPDSPGRLWHEEPGVVRFVFFLRRRLEQATHFGADEKFVPRFAGEELADPAFGETETVVRRGIEVADAEIPGGRERRVRLRIIDRSEQVSEFRASE